MVTSRGVLEHLSHDACGSDFRVKGSDVLRERRARDIKPYWRLGSGILAVGMTADILTQFKVGMQNRGYLITRIGL